MDNIPDDITCLCTRDPGGMPLGVAQSDRLRHIYLAGMTGTGKSTLLLNMLAQDIAAGRGAALIDPHGDLAEALLDHVPAGRTRDVVYFAPGELTRPIGINVLANVAPDKRAMAADNVVSAFKHIWHDSWGPRLEHFLYNAVAALMDTPGQTLLGVPRLFTDADYRARIVARVQDPVVRGFWVHEFPRYDQRFLGEAVSPILNKVSRFLAAPAVRNVVGQPKSSVDLGWAMDTERLFIANLAKGTMGEGHANLLGALLLTQFHLAAMARADVDEAERVPFHLHVDEFQNYGTQALPAMLSEARKYKLSLTLAHQHLAQLSPATQEAVFGNCATVIAFRVGSSDAERFARELAPMNPEELTHLSAHQVWVRTVKAGRAMPRFPGATLPPPQSPAGRSEIVIAQSRERYGRDRDKIEARIERFLGNAEGGLHQGGTR